MTAIPEHSELRTTDALDEGLAVGDGDQVIAFAPEYGDGRQRFYLLCTLQKVTRLAPEIDHVAHGA
jgi:hypothetical protein